MPDTTTPTGQAEKTVDSRMVGMIDSSMRTYRERGERAALRCAIGDAAHICDMIRMQILDETRSRGGKGPHSKLGKQLAEIATRCGDQLWLLREQINLEDPAS